jgi:DNA-binding response OmpR family regulator
LILVVDDTKDACDPLRRLLEMTGFPATCAYSGEEALESMHTTTPSLVILDYMMGGKNGLDVFREMKAHVCLEQQRTGFAVMASALIGLLERAKAMLDFLDLRTVASEEFPSNS